MYNFVTAQRGRLAEPFAAYLTNERSGARVHGHVSRQVVMRVEHFTAVRAREGLVLAARPRLRRLLVLRTGRRFSLLVRTGAFDDFVFGTGYGMATRRDAKIVLRMVVEDRVML